MSPPPARSPSGRRRPGGSAIRPAPAGSSSAGHCPRPAAPSEPPTTVGSPLNALMIILKPLSSLYIAVSLLLCGMLLIYTGTLAQRSQGIWDIQHQYFHGLGLWIPFQNL